MDSGVPASDFGEGREPAAAPRSPRSRARFLKRDTPPHIVTLVMLAGLGALSMNIFLPSLPAMTEWFETDYAIMQLTISGYLAMTAIAQLIVGPLSDRYGRRPVLLASIAIFIAATAWSAFAPTVEAFLAARMVQASVVSGLVLSRAIVRDMVPLEEAASMIGYVTMGMALVPMVAPVFGGLLQEAYGWHSVVWFSVTLGIIVWIVTFLDVQETNLHRTASMTSQFRSYPELIRSRRFWGFVVASTFASGMFYAFLGGAPYVAERHLDLSPALLGLYFIFISLGYMAGNFFTGRYSARIGIFPLMAYGGVIAVFGVLLAMAWFALGGTHAAGFFLPLFFVGVGNGMVMPSGMAGMINVRPHLAGSAAGLGGAMMIGGGAGLSFFAGHLLTPESGPAPLLILMAVSGALGVVVTLWTQRIDRQMKAAGEDTMNAESRRDG